MYAALLTLALFASWWLIGIAVLVASRAHTGLLRVVLTAPIIGTCAAVLPLFVLSHIGLAMEYAGPAVLVALVVSSVLVLAVRRPKLHAGVAPVVAVSVAGLLLAGWPMFEFGLRWIAFANPDMANYVLSATHLMQSGLLAPMDLGALANGQGYPSVTASLHRDGARPGSDITLAAVSSLNGRPAQDLFMPLIFSLHLSAICGAGALAMQAAKRWWAAAIAAALLALSPMATYGVLLQLMPQVWGLGLATALCALLMRRELHQGSRPGFRDLGPISLLTAALILVYVELAATVALAYALYVAVLAMRRELDLRVAAWVWGAAVGFTAIVLNEYLVRELRFVLSQTGLGVGGHVPGPVTPFDFALIPSALAGIVGFQKLPIEGSDSHFLEWSIAVAFLLLGAALVASVVTALRGVAASVLLVGYALLAVVLGIGASEFGLFKLYMYLQPFLAAAVAVWLTSLSRGRALAIVGVPLMLVVAVQLSTQQAYVEVSRNPPGFRNASAAGMLPKFERIVAEAKEPVISVTGNPTLGKLEAAAVGRHPLYFLSENFFTAPTSQAARHNGWRRRLFDLSGSDAEQTFAFWDNEHASAVLSADRCTIVLPGDTQTVLNRRSLREGNDLIAKPCDALRNTLVYTESELGLGHGDYSDLRRVSSYQPEDDPFFRGRTMSGFGRYVFLRVLDPADTVRLAIALTTATGKTLPPAAVFGEDRVALPLLGGGSARVFSAPFRTQTIDGQSYALLDMGRDGELPSVRRRTGIEGLFGGSIRLDSRYLTAWARDVSLVTDAEYRRLPRPRAIASFPDGLEHPSLEYSGIQEHGWVGKRSYVVLAGGARAYLRLRAQVPPAPGGQRLQLLVNGRRVANRKVVAGLLEMLVPVPASSSPRRVEMRWSAAPRLPAPDTRSFSALIEFLGVVASGDAPVAVQEFPADLSAPGVRHSGIWRDGWVEQRASLTLAGGAAGSLRLQAQVPPAPRQRLQLLVNGREVADRKVAAVEFEVLVPIPASSMPRRVELRWAKAARLPAPDGRSVAALLRFLGVVARRSS